MKNHLPPVSYEAFAEQFARPPGKLFLLYGNALAFDLSLWMTAQASGSGKMIAVVDGCNRFNVHTISKFARRHRIDPHLLLRRIFLSRGFTCYQMEAAITERLPLFLRQSGSTIALIFGLLDTFYDEQAPFREVTQILRRVIAALQEMRRAGNSLLLVCEQWNVYPPERNRLFQTLKSSMDRVYRVDITEAHTPLLIIEHRKGHLDGSYRRNVY